MTTDNGATSFVFNPGDSDLGLFDAVPEALTRDVEIGDLFRVPGGRRLGRLGRLGTGLGEGSLGTGLREGSLGQDLGARLPGHDGLATDPPEFPRLDDPPILWKDPLLNEGIFWVDPDLQWPPAVVRPPVPTSAHRRDLTIPIAPRAVPTDGDLFESPDGSVKYALPRYSLAFDKIGVTDEPRVVIADRDGTATLMLTFVETPSPAAGPGVAELPHVISVSMKYRVPVISGESLVLELPFPSVRLDATQTVVTAEMPLTTPGLRQQVLAALASLEAAVSLVVGRGVTVGVPTGETLEDGLPGYRQERLLLEWTAPPLPLVLSEAQRERLGGDVGGVRPMGRVRVPFGGRSHSYWQDPARPERYYYLPDRFLLARLASAGRPPALRVRATGAASEDAVRVTMEFSAQPVLQRERLEAARPILEQEARAKGASGPVRLEILPDAQPVLRLALPEGGAPSSALTERPAADIDLELGVTHAETLGLEDFRLVYDALFGASLSLLRGEVRVGAGGGTPDDVPLELRLDRTAGDVLALTPTESSATRITARLVNEIESPVRPGRLVAVALCGDRRVPLRIEGLPGDAVLPAGEGVDVRLVPESPLPDGGADTIALDQSDAVAEPDRQAIWALVFDRTAQPQLTRDVRVEAVPALFAGPPGDQVAVFVVVVERGGTVRLTETELTAVTTVRVPVQPLLTGAPIPPLRYRTETLWQSGGVGVSGWRETDATILLPMKTAPGTGGA
ncbi:hypothetical protein N5079_29740 [Planotetraspora sp. A-T 1434]|uniref:hypothetical protein n=1 Tax=Planotetraspora sp. A-T 1434 TaxID=2979219 RepID=UPI0021C08A57|nr:hypothetical protein [Planotetraspora sp. A-T 1434]MCT9934395.1 hypothetical protein [Planotetraspora sp. A-T 1434]